MGRVQIIGLNRAEAGPPMVAFGLGAGDRFRERPFRDGVRALEEGLDEQGFFEARVTAREPAWDRATNRVDLTVQVTEGPLTQIEFAGRQALPEKSLRERLTFADSGLVDEVEVRSSTEQVQRAYREAGYNFARVSGTLGGDATTRVVKFDIEEGPRVIVERITLEGATTLPASSLRDRLETRTKGLLTRGLFVEETLARDVRNLRLYLQSQGFGAAEVGPPLTTFSEDRTLVQIVIPIVEGARRLVGAISVKGNRAVPTELILKTIGLSPGDPWDDARVEDGRRRAEALYQRRGYRGTEVSLTTAETADGMSATYAVEEGEPVRIGQVLISGLTATKPYVVERELQFAPGGQLTAVDLSETRRRLDATRLFDRVDVEARGPASAPFRDVEIAVREAKPWRVEFGAGYATDEGFRGYVSLNHDNLFGTGRSAGIRERVSQLGDRTDIVYREPWVFGTLLQGEAVGFRENKDEVGFVSDRLGTTFTVQRELLHPVLPPGGADRSPPQPARRPPVPPGAVSASRHRS